MTFAVRLQRGPSSWHCGLPRFQESLIFFNRAPKETAPTMAKGEPSPILKTRVPLELQKIFLASNRGETVVEPPKNGLGFKVFERRLFRRSSSFGGRRTSRRIFFGEDEKVEFDKNLPPVSITTDDASDVDEDRTMMQLGATTRWASNVVEDSLLPPSPPRNLSPSRGGKPKVQIPMLAEKGRSLSFSGVQRENSLIRMLQHGRERTKAKLEDDSSCQSFPDDTIQCRWSSSKTIARTEVGGSVPRLPVRHIEMYH